MTPGGRTACQSRHGRGAAGCARGRFVGHDLDRHRRNIWTTLTKISTPQESMKHGVCGPLKVPHSRSRVQRIRIVSVPPARPGRIFIFALGVSSNGGRHNRLEVFFNKSSPRFTPTRLVHERPALGPTLQGTAAMTYVPEAAAFAFTFP